MTKRTRPLIAGNWKMNGLRQSAVEIEAIVAALRAEPAEADVLICPPATLIAAFADAAEDAIAIGGQDCHALEKGAFTGDISAEMLADAGASHVIIGHSERRQYHQENDSVVAAKLKAAWRAKLHPILCVGETLGERETGATLAIIDRQLDGALADIGSAKLSIAYEPVWAIGTGKTPTLAEIVEVHGHIRRRISSLDASLKETRLLYGGSVNPANAQAILALGDVDGALVGGASLKAADFLAIIRAAGAATV